MLNERLKSLVADRLLPHVQRPAQYLGGELNAVRKDHSRSRQALPGLSRHLYRRHEPSRLAGALHADESAGRLGRASGPSRPGSTWKRNCAGRVPLYSLETFTPLADFDVLGFTLQYELSFTNVLTMLDLGAFRCTHDERTLADPLVIAGGPCAQNPEPLARSSMCSSSATASQACRDLRHLVRTRDAFGRPGSATANATDAEQRARAAGLELAGGFPSPMSRGSTSPNTTPTVACWQLHPHASGRARHDRAVGDRRSGAMPLPKRPIVPYDRMRARPDRHRNHARLPLAVPLLPEHGDQAAAASATRRNDRGGSLGRVSQHGLHEISLLSLSTSDYP